jgi:hypothetical protein
MKIGAFVAKNLYPVISDGNCGGIVGKAYRFDGFPSTVL